MYSESPLESRSSINSESDHESPFISRKKRIWDFGLRISLLLLFSAIVIGQLFYMVPFWLYGEFKANEIVPKLPVIKLSNISQSDELYSHWHTLTIYQLYYDEKAWEVVGSNHKTIPYFRGMCVVPFMTRPNSSDVSAPSLLPILKDTRYQSLLCEYGAILATANDAERWKVNSSTPFALEPSRWIGFESWRAQQKANEISRLSLPFLDRALETRETFEEVVYWGTDDSKPDFYKFCVQFHGENCPKVYATVFEVMFGRESKIIIDGSPSCEVTDSVDYLPEMPSISPGWAYYSYFIMSKSSLVQYSRFARAFFVTLESLYNVHDDESRCPIDPFTYSKKLCWCFIMERLVNIWFFHSGKPTYIMLRDGKTVDLPDPNVRQMRSWFRDDVMSAKLDAFEARLEGRSLALYRALQGE